jgi:ketosteroid isomerase-like protein
MEGLLSPKYRFLIQEGDLMRRDEGLRTDVWRPELLDLGHGVVLSVLREGGRLVGGKGRVEQRVAHLTTWTNGKIEWFKHYPDPDEGRAAAERLAQERG